MDLLWLVLGPVTVVGILALAILVALPRYRKHGVEQARTSLSEVPSVLTRIDNSLQPYLSSKEYLPERVGRPLRSEIQTLLELTLPSLGRSVRRTHDSAMRKDFESITTAANQLWQKLAGYNYQYVHRAINEHSNSLRASQLDEAGPNRIGTNSITVSLSCLSNNRRITQPCRCRVSGATGANTSTPTLHAWNRNSHSSSKTIGFSIRRRSKFQ